jgi:DGQHR domain-containing protein
MPGWIVDGQQRCAAIREANVDSFPIFAVGFLSENVADQREQFILVNSTKPLPKGLIYELLPETSGKLPSLLHRRRFPAMLMNRMNSDETSPLKNLIKTPTVPQGLIKDNSILKMIENSLSDGALYRFRNPNDGNGDIDAMLKVLYRFWEAVSTVFAEDWNLPPRRSRLVHGAGIVTMGFLMDAICDRFRTQGTPSVDEFINDLFPLKPFCRWTNGYWEFGPGAQRKWNEIQNIPRDIQLLSNYMLVLYKQQVWNKPEAITNNN